MSRVLCLTKRNLKETFKDYVALIFIIALPVLMLVVMEVLYGKEEEINIFKITNFSAGICNFGFAFTMLYLALTITTDRESAFMKRILVSPVKDFEYILSFVLYAFPIMFLQTVVFYLISIIFGLKLNGDFFLSILFLIPSMIFYISCGILFGVISKNEKTVGPISSIVISGGGILGGIWMPVETTGKGFLTVCKVLPFYNGVKTAKDVFNGLSIETLYSFLIITVWSVVLFVLSYVIFKKKIRK